MPLWPSESVSISFIHLTHLVGNLHLFRFKQRAFRESNSGTLGFEMRIIPLDQILTLAYTIRIYDPGVVFPDLKRLNLSTGKSTRLFQLMYSTFFY